MYGCQVRDRYQTRVSTPYDTAACAEVSAATVLRRVCDRVAVDERVYLAARLHVYLYAEGRSTVGARHTL